LSRFSESAGDVERCPEDLGGDFDAIRVAAGDGFVRLSQQF
jgi:hypothetical protein